MKILITITLLFGVMIGSSYCFDGTEWYLFQNFGIPLGPHHDNYDESYEEHKGMNNDETMENMNNEAKYTDDLADDDDDTIDEIGGTSYVDLANSSDNSSSNEENNNNTEEEEEEENIKKSHKKPYKKEKDLKMLNKKYKKVDSEPKIKKSFYYVSPDDVEFELTRNKRSTDKYDYNEAYREFIKKNFGDDSVRPYQADENEDESGEASDENTDSDEHGDAEGYKEDVNNNEGDSSSDESGEVDNDYLHVKEESDKSAAESTHQSKHCKLVHKDGQQCSICKNPKTNDQSESCSYSSSPPPKRYAFKKKSNHGYKKDDDNVDEENPEEYVSRHRKKSQPKKYENSEEKYNQKKPKSKKLKKSKKEDKSAEGSGISPNYWGYHDRRTDTSIKPHGSYDQDLIYHASEPFAATFNSQKSGSNVDDVLNSFRSRDWSNCKQKKFDGFTCYYCKQPNGATEEECMFLQDEDNHSHDPQTSQTKTIPQTLAKPSKIRQLNRNQNYKSNPRNSENLESVKIANRRMDVIQPEKYIEGGAKPTKTLDYIEPQGTRTLKRMISVKLEEEKDSPSKSILYSKMMKG